MKLAEDKYPQHSFKQATKCNTKMDKSTEEAKTSPEKLKKELKYSTQKIDYYRKPQMNSESSRKKSENEDTNLKSRKFCDDDSVSNVNTTVSSIKSDDFTADDFSGLKTWNSMRIQNSSTNEKPKFAAVGSWNALTDSEDEKIIPPESSKIKKSETNRHTWGNTQQKISQPVRPLKNEPLDGTISSHEPNPLNEPGA